MRMRRATRRALKGAELNLETYGWVRGEFGNEDVGFCLVGAVRHSTRNPLTRWRVYRALEARGAWVPGVLSCASVGVMMWNDLFYAGGGTEERVLKLIRRTLGEEP